MHPINKILSCVGLRLARTKDMMGAPPKFIKQYKKYLDVVKLSSKDFVVFEDFNYQAGSHPTCFKDFECAFAAYHINNKQPNSILDVGSYRLFIIGLLAKYQVTTIDIRSRKKISDNETILNCDAKNINLPNDKFDAVLSLCSLEHIGLGRYGDEFDLQGDKTAFNEMIRCLKPGGIIIFSTTITNAKPSICFNGHRIYNYNMIKEFCKNFELVEEKFYSNQIGDFCSFEEVTTSSSVWDVYLGCWKKPLNYLR